VPSSKTLGSSTVQVVVDLSLDEETEEKTPATQVAVKTIPMVTVDAEFDENKHASFSAVIQNLFDVQPREEPIFMETSLSNKSKVKFTPLEQQVVDIRKVYSNCILMVECGYRMRFFGTDASIAAKVLGIYAHIDHNFNVASIPTYRTIVHCRRLVAAGYKVIDIFFQH
jgi:hypothetical protein